RCAAEIHFMHIAKAHLLQPYRHRCPVRAINEHHRHRMLIQRIGELIDHQLPIMLDGLLPRQENRFDTACIEALPEHAHDPRRAAAVDSDAGDEWLLRDDTCCDNAYGLSDRIVPSAHVTICTWW